MLGDQLAGQSPPKVQKEEGPNRPVIVYYDSMESMVWHIIIWYTIKWYILEYGIVWYGIFEYGILWNGILEYSMVW